MSNVTFSISVESGMKEDSEPVPSNLQSRIYYQKGVPHLDLSLCSIASVPLSAIRELYGKPKSLNLSYNRIRSLSSKFVSELNNLQILDLSKNQLKSLPDNFGKLEHLVFLDIHQNKLQSLPLSMGKMTRLTYLNLSDNPFGPPLHDFLEFQKRVSNDEQGVIDTAHLVINFLATLSQQSFSTRDSSITLALPAPPPPPQPVQRQRTVTFVDESISNTNNNNVTWKSKSTLTQHKRSTVQASSTTITETEGNSDDEDDHIKEDEFIPRRYAVEYSKSDLGPYLKKKKKIAPKNSSPWPHPKGHRSIGHTLAIPAPTPVAFLPETKIWKQYKLLGVIMFIIWLLMLPMTMAMIFETSAVDHLVMGNESLEPFWKSYRPIHQGIVFAMDFLGLHDGFVVRAPSPIRSKYDDLNHFTAMIYAFREALASIFQSMADFIQPAYHTPGAI